MTSAPAFRIPLDAFKAIERPLRVPDVHALVAEVVHLSAFPNMELHLPDLARNVRRSIALSLRRFADNVDPGPGSMETLEGLSRLHDDWDGEGAPKPSGEAITRAREILQALEGVAEVDAIEVDADVLGGVGLLVRPGRGRSVWIACMNNGKDTVVLSEGESLSHAPWDASALEQTLSFVRAAHGS